jgi:restriction endonuclease S subunit
MKNSTNKLPTGWEWLKIEDICFLGRGRVISKKEILANPGDYPVYSSQTLNNGIFGQIATYDFDGEYVTWTTDGAYAGTVFYRNGKFNCTNVCGTLKAKDKNIDMKLLSIFLNNYTKSEVFIASGNPKLMNNVMADIKIPFPLDIKEQKRIVKIIETKINAVEKIIELTKEQLSVIDLLFDAYLRKLLKKNALPESWEWKKLGDICIEDKTIINGRNSDLPFIGLEMIKSKTGEIDWEAQTMSGVSTCYYFDERHILYGKLRPSLNKVVLPKFKGRCSTELVPLFTQPDNNREFIAYLLRRNDTIDYVMTEKTGSRMPRANMKHLLNMKVMVPSLPEQENIVKLIKSKMICIENLNRILCKQYSYFESIPQSLLRQAFQGKL